MSRSSPRSNFPRSPRTLREHMTAALQARRSWLPLSFYFLFLIPLVLLLCIDLLENRAEPGRFVLGTSLLFLFLGIVLLLAVGDIVQIARRMLREHNSTWDQTVGHEAFVRELGGRVRQQSEDSDANGTLED